MKKENRLRTSAQFKEVANYKVSVSYGCISMRGRPNNLATARLGMAIPKKIGNAVQRNAIKRRIRAAITPLLNSLIGLDMTLTTSQVALEKRFSGPIPRIEAMFTDITKESYT